MNPDFGESVLGNLFMDGEWGHWESPPTNPFDITQQSCLRIWQPSLSPHLPRLQLPARSIGPLSGTWEECSEVDKN